MDSAFVTLVMTLFTGLTIIRIWINRFQCAKVIALLPVSRQEEVRRFVALHQAVLILVLTVVSTTLRVSLTVLDAPVYLVIILYASVVVAVVHISEGLETRLATQFLPELIDEPVAS